MARRQVEVNGRRSQKILFCIRVLDYGGADRQLTVLANGLRQCGKDVVVAVSYSTGPLQKVLEDAQVPVHSLGKHGRWDVLGFLWRIIRMVHHERPAIVHSYLTASNILTIFLKVLFPHIRIVWGVRGSQPERSRYNWLMRCTYKIESRLSHFADLIIANSHAGLADAVAQGFPKEKMVVVPNGIDTERFCPDPEARARLRKAWGIRREEKLLGLVARFDPMKDHPVFLRAASFLVQQHKDVRFVCVGDGPVKYRLQFLALSQELQLADRVLWPGVCRDMPAVYNALDILVSSSAYGEGFSNAIGEAMACGVPCVVTDIGDSSRIVGLTGIIVPPKDPGRLATMLHALLADNTGQLARYGVTARARIQSLYNVSRIVETTENLLWPKE